MGVVVVSILGICSLFGAVAYLTRDENVFFIGKNKIKRKDLKIPGRSLKVCELMTVSFAKKEIDKKLAKKPHYLIFKGKEKNQFVNEFYQEILIYKSKGKFLDGTDFVVLSEEFYGLEKYVPSPPILKIEKKKNSSYRSKFLEMMKNNDSYLDICKEIPFEYFLYHLSEFDKENYNSIVFYENDIGVI